MLELQLALGATTPKWRMSLLPSSFIKTTLAKRAFLLLLIAMDVDDNSDSDSNSNSKTAAGSFIHNLIRQTSRQKRSTLKAAKEMQKQKDQVQPYISDQFNNKHLLNFLIKLLKSLSNCLIGC
jgi:hypothetical protein